MWLKNAWGLCDLMFYFLLENATQGVPISFLLPGTSKIEHELQIEIELSNPRLKNGPQPAEPSQFAVVRRGLSPRTPIPASCPRTTASSTPASGPSRGRSPRSPWSPPPRGSGRPPRSRGSNAGQNTSHRKKRKSISWNTGFLSEIGTKLRDWAVGQAGGSCYSQADLSSNGSKTL